MLRAKDCRELDAGFAAVLTDFISGTLAGCGSDPEYYEDLIEGDATPAV